MPKKVYECTYCNLTTYKKTDFMKHLKTKKHAQQSKVADDSVESVDLSTEISPKVEKFSQTQSMCPYCKKKFSRVASYDAHMSKCFKFVKIAHTCDSLKKEIEELRKENNKLRDKLSDSNNITNFYNKNVFTHIQEVYSDAPPLKKLDDVQELPQLKNITDKKDGNVKLCQNLSYHKSHNRLHKYLGDVIIQIYKKKDPHHQSFWNTDCSRLTYAVRELIDKIPKWRMDKKGVLLQERVIDPLLKFVYDHVYEYSNDYIKYSYKLDSRVKITQEGALMLEIMSDIENGKLKQDIIRYIAPFFAAHSQKEDFKQLEYKSSIRSSELDTDTEIETLTLSKE